MFANSAVSNSILVSMSTLCVVLNNITIFIKSTNKATKRIVCYRKVDKEFSFHIFTYRYISINIYATLDFRIVCRDFLFCVSDRTSDVVLNIALTNISCRLTIKSS